MNLSERKQSVISFFKEINFARAFLVVFAAVSPLIVFSHLGLLSVGIGLTVGVFLSSPGDVPGGFKRRIYGILISILFAVTTSLVGGYALANTFFFVLVLAGFVFLYSFIAVFGFRASLVSFSGLLAVVLSMARISPEVSVLAHSLYIGVGGMWYLLLVFLIHFLNPRRPVELSLAEASKQTASYLRMRTSLIVESQAQQKELFTELSALQTELNNSHESLRELLLSERRTSGKSNDARKKLLIFMKLVDLLELGMANPIRSQRMDELLSEHKDHLELLRTWTFSMADQLEFISLSLRNRRKFKQSPELGKLAEEVRNSFKKIRKKHSSTDVDLMSLYHFKEKQYQKITSIGRLLQDLDLEEEFILKRKEALKFLPTQEYNFRTLQDNFDWKSSIFRHSIRLTLVVLIGYGLGYVFELHNAYWIILTSIVIMRPGYGLTKQRSKQRLIGTLIGGVVAASIILVVQDAIVYGILAVISFVFGLAMIQKNYKASAAFITLNVVFVYALITPNAFEVIQFRVVDTLIGSGLAILGNSMLWPYWEVRGINDVIIESLKANRVYLKKVEEAYQLKRSGDTSFKLSRKEAFLAMSSLSGAFQRMTQEPKSQQKNSEKFYKIVGLNQEFLSSTASLGSFIMTHKTTAASEHFHTFISGILTNIENTINNLQEKPTQEILNRKKLDEAERYFKKTYQELFELNNTMFGEEIYINNEAGVRLQEARMIIDQLKWLLEISTSMEQLTSSQDKI